MAYIGDPRRCTLPAKDEGEQQAGSHDEEMTQTQIATHALTAANSGQS